MKMRTGNTMAVVPLTVWQRGFTLIELLVSLSLTIMVMSMVLGINYQTSAALRTFARGAESSDGLVAAREMISNAARTAGGYLPPTGLRVSKSLGGTTAATGQNLKKFLQCQPQVVGGQATGLCMDFSAATHQILMPVAVRNGFYATGDWSDQLLTIRGEREPIVAYPTAPAFRTAGIPLAVRTADDAAAIKGRVVAIVTTENDSGCLIRLGQPNAFGSTSLVTTPPGFNGASAQTLGYDAGLPENTGMSNDSVCPWGQGTVYVIPIEVEGYFLAANKRVLHRVDKSLDLAASPSGGWDSLLNGVSEAIGVDFTNLQFAVRYFEASDQAAGADDADLDGDPRRDWYGANQQANMANSLSSLRTTSATGSGYRAADGIPVALGIVIERRSTRFNDVRTAVTPSLARPQPTGTPGQNYNNAYGDAPAVSLTADTANQRYTSNDRNTISLDPDGNGQPDGLPYMFNVTSSVIALRNAGGTL